MAEEALQKVEEDLNCLVCLEVYTDPKVLQCHHVFCRGCLEGLVARRQREGLSLHCPSCRKVTPISPEEGVAGLQPAFHINSLLDILSHHKKATKELKKVEQENDTGVHENAKSDSNTGIKEAKDESYCPDHSSRILESFCETCDKLICLECALDHHKGHECTLVSRLFEKSREDVLSSLKSVESHVELMRKSIEAIHTRQIEISQKKGDLLAEVCEQARLIQEATEARKVELVNRIHDIAKDKLCDLASQKDQGEQTVAQLCKYLDDTYEKLETSSHEEVMKMKTGVAKHAKDLSESFQPDSLEPTASVDTLFVTKIGLASECRSFGDVYASGSPSASECEASGEGLQAAVVDEKSTVIVQHFSWQKLRPSSTECEIISELTSERVNCCIELLDESQLEITYQPATKGKHQFSIKVKGQHIEGSPFTVDVKLPVEKLGRPILTFAAENPRGIAISKKGEVIITEASEQLCAISSFNLSGKRIRSFNNEGFKSPSKLAVDNNENILVVDKEAHCFWQFSQTGQQLLKVEDIAASAQGSTFWVVGAGIGAGIAGPIGGLVGGAIGAGVGAFTPSKSITIKLDAPCSFAFNFYNNKVYVLDGSQVQILYPDSTFFNAFGKSGSSNGEFNSPSGIACDSAGKVYVADTGNHRIQVFTARGKFLKMFGNQGEDKEQIREPHGIAVDSNGIVYVSQPYEHCVSVFTASGRFVTSFSTRLEDEELSKYGPMEIAVDSQGIVYVCDPLACKVKVF